MLIAARLALLLAGVAGAVFAPAKIPRFVAPLVCAGILLSSGLVPLADARGAVESMEIPVGFLLAAIPLAVLLDRTGYFEQVAEIFADGDRLLLGLWVLGAATVAVLNLDAAVVLLTPLYVRIAQRHKRPVRLFGFQPVLLALLASSLLPVSNLTNLIVSARFGLSTGAFVVHLGLPTVVASAVGYPLYRLSARTASGRDEVVPDAAASPVREPVTRDKRVLIGGSLVVLLVLVGFTAGQSLGISDWQVALGADVLLVAVTRRLPLASIPWETALVALTLAVLATAATRGLQLSSLLSGSGPLAAIRGAGFAAVGANVVNNLPALLVALPYVRGSGGHVSCSLWPILYGVNTGPGLLVTGSLASLLWLDAMRRFGARVHAAQYFAVGLRVVIPAAIAGLAVLVALAPAVGCG